MFASLVTGGRISLVAWWCAFALCASAQGGLLTVDGNVSDWGFKVADNNGSTWVPAPNIGLVGMMLEDTDDKAKAAFFVGPGYGGQKYDAEALAVAVQDNQLFILIVSGQRPNNGLSLYGPGDLRITTSTADYGVEIGGGAGGGSGSMLVGGEPGSRYSLNSEGDTTAHNATPAAQTAGSIWRNPTWLYNTLAPPADRQTQFLGGTKVGDATYRFTRNTVTTQHSIIEMSIPLALFGGATIEWIAWHPACGNDELFLQTSFVPEPGTWTLATAGAAALAPLGCRRKRAPRGV